MIYRRQVEIFLSVDKSEKPLEVLKASLRQIFHNAQCKLEGIYNLGLGALDGSGPTISLEELADTWLGTKKYIKVHGDNKDLF